MLSLLIPAFAMMPGITQANPSGGAVVHGGVTFEGLDTANLRITQGTDKAIINWQDFSIGKGELTQFIQPGKNSSVLNRVVSGNPSAIFGTLKANGGVMVVNTNGILVGAGGVVDVAGALTLSTLDIDDNDFLNGGDNRFRGNSSAGVTNYGTISAGGDVVLLGNFIDNRGVIGSVDGTVAMGAGGDIIVHQSGDAKISIKAAGRGGEVGTNNEGTIEGAAVELKAHGNVYALAINNSGMIRANGANYTGGILTLDAGTGGVITNTGTLRARNADGSGGTININAGRTGTVNLEGGEVDASGDGNRAGGVIDVQGAYFNIDGGAVISADGETGGVITIGNESNTRSVNIGAGSTVSTVGSSGDGGTINVNGRADGVINLRGDLLANGSVNGGTVSVIGGTVNQFGTSTINAAGGSGSGGVINLNGLQSVTANGTLDASSVSGDAGSVTVGSLVGDATFGGTAAVNSLLGKGGNFDVVSREAVAVTANASADVSGFTSAGQIRAGGGLQGNESDMLNSKSTVIEAGAEFVADSEGGNAGRVIVWSDGDTTFSGSISARALGAIGNGGFMEVSGKDQLQYRGRVNASAVSGANGTLLLDPTDVSIGPGAGVTISDSALVEAILTNNVVIHTSSAGSDVGNIVIDAGSDIQYDSPNSLAFFAHGNISVNGDIKNHGTSENTTVAANGTTTGNITLVAGWDGTGAANFAFDPTAATGIPSSTNPVITAADVLAGTYGAWGQNGGSVLLNDAALEPVEVGSARGETNAFGDQVRVTSGNGQGEFTQLGYRRENDVRGRARIAGGTIRTGLDLDFHNGVTGDINVHAITGVLLRQNANENSSDGVKSNDRAYVMIGHGGMREQDNDIDNRGAVTNDSLDLTDYGSDSGNVSVGNGNNSGDIVVMGGLVVYLQAGRAESHAQIGHGGYANDDPDADRANTVSDSGLGDNNFRNTHIFGNMSGDITVIAGSIELEGGLLNDVPVMIGNGGTRVRGEHSGNITVEATVGDVRARAAPNSASGGPANSNDWRWRNNRDQSHAQIGHGGFDSDFIFVDSLGEVGAYGDAAGKAVLANVRGRGAYDTSGNTPLAASDGTGFHLDARPRRTVTLNTGDPDGGGVLVAGPNSVTNSSFVGDGIAINPETGQSYGHSGDISVTAVGSVEFVASNGADAYAMLGHGGRSTHGDHRGNITVNAGGNVTFTREAFQVNERGRDITNRGHRAHVQIGHGGTRYQGGATGDIDVNAGGDIQFDGGRSEAYAMIGHGGRGEDGSTWRGGRQRNEHANGTHSGDINVVAGGDIRFRAGFTDVQAHAMIGHGGYYQPADAIYNPAIVYNAAQVGDGVIGTDGAVTAIDEGHNGNITVSSGGDISFIAGQDYLLTGQTFMEMNGGDNFTMIGHGGRYTKGDHSGTIDITATGNLYLESRGGWDAVTIDGTNEDITQDPFLNNTADNGRTGYRNFAQIGHGGHDSEHVNTNATQNWNNSGKNGDGIGTAQTSDITITLGGDLTVLAAPKATTIDKVMPIRIIEDNGAGNPIIADVQNTYLDEALNSVTPGAGFSQFNGRLETVTRSDGEVWNLPDPVLSSEDSYAQIGNGGRATDYRGSGGLANGGGQSERIVDTRGHRGDITIDAGGNIRVEASDIKQAVSTGQALEITVTSFNDVTPNPGGVSNGDGTGSYFVGPSVTVFIGGDDSQDDPSQGTRNYAMIGLGGDTARGDHSGTITITGGGDLDLIAGEGRQAFAQIGNGGYDSDRVNNDGQRDGDTGATTTIGIDIDGKLTMKGGGLQNGDTTGDVASIDTATNIVTVTTDNDIVRGSYAQIGSGGLSNGGSHHADIDITTGTGVEIEAGNSHRGAYGIIGSGGTWGRSETLSGNISVVAETGDIDLIGAKPVLDDGVNDGFSGPANDGNLQTARESFVQIGNGGFDTDAQGGNQNNSAGNGGYSGDITVVAAAGSVSLTGGGTDALNIDNDNMRNLSVKIGHGGPYSDGDSTGDIRVSAGVDLTITGGRSGLRSFAQIGHGGNQAIGAVSGLIDIEVGNNLLMQHGSVASTNGVVVRDADAKIGHGSSINQGNANNGSGGLEGDITISVGEDITTLNGVDADGAENVYGAQIGHVDTKRSTNPAIATPGNTYIAASRNNPTGGSGTITLSNQTVVSSADGGFLTELRFYMPTPAQDRIAEGAWLNNAGYTRAPTPGTRGGADEHIATEHTLGVGAFGEPTGDYATPAEGVYPFHGFGLYNIYFFDSTVVPVTPPRAVGVPVEVVIPEVVLVPTLFNFFPFLFLDKFDSFDRDDEGLDGLTGEGGGLFSAIGLFEANEEETEGDGPFFLEELLDESLGNGEADYTEGEEEEEQERREARLGLPIGGSDVVFYVFDPDTNKYSSFKVFGASRGGIQRAR